MLNKIGLHTVGGFAGAYGPSPVIKLVNASPEFWRQVRQQVGTNVLMIWRKTLGDQPLNDPVNNARAFYNNHRAEMLQCLGYGGRCAMSSYNEIDDPSAEAYNLFLVELLRLAHADGIPVCVGDWSVGRPDLPVVLKYAGALNAMRPGDVIGLHEYWIDTKDIGNDWHCGRWVHSPLLMEHDIVVTECSRDIVEKQGAPGWQLTCGEDEIIGDFVLYDQLLQRYPRVIGAVVFSAGDGLNDAEFGKFRVDSIWGKVVQRMETTAVTPPTPVVIQEPPMTIVGRCFDEQGVRKFIQGVNYSQWKPTSIWLHHTATPDLVSWKGYETIAAMKAYYDRQEWTDAQGRKHIGWGSGPHFFVAPEGIWAFTPPNQEGSHVYGFNDHSIGVEMVGNYQNNRPSGEVLEYTIWLLMVCCKQFGVAPEDVHFHRDANAVYPAMATSCPGQAVTKEWLLPKVRAIMLAWDGLPTDEAMTDPKILVQKSRAWQEELTRALEAGRPLRALDISRAETVLLSRAENALV